MVTLLLIKEKLEHIYSKYDRYLRMLLKFVLAFSVLSVLDFYLGYVAPFGNFVVLFAMSAICGILPSGAISLLGCIVILGNLATVSIEALLAGGILMLILFLCYLLYGVGYGVYLILVVATCLLGQNPLLMLVMGIIALPHAGIPAAFGYFLYALIETTRDNLSAFAAANSSLSMVQKLMLLFDGTFTDPSIYLMMIAGFTAMFAVYGIRKLSVNYAAMLAPVFGGMGYLLILFGGSFAMDLPLELGAAVIPAILGMILAAAVEFFVRSVDYSRVEYAQFEDDKYVYYVKAIPKMVVGEAETKVKSFTTKKSRKKASQVIIQEEPQEKAVGEEAKPQAFSQAFAENMEK